MKSDSSSSKKLDFKSYYRNYDAQDVNGSRSSENTRKYTPTLFTLETESRDSHISRQITDSPSEYLQGFDVHSIIEQYNSHPELLELVLSCKVQEDKRKTEEAKLRQREIDYLLSSEEEISKTMDHVHIHQNHSSYRDERSGHVERRIPSILLPDRDNTNISKTLPSYKGKERLNSDYKLDSPYGKFSPVDKRHRYQNTPNEDYFSYTSKQPNSPIYPSGSPVDSIGFKPYNQLSSPSSLPSLRSPLQSYSSLRNFSKGYENEISHQRHRRNSETCLYDNKDDINNMLPPIQFSKRLLVNKSKDGNKEASPLRYSDLTSQIHGKSEKQATNNRYNLEKLSTLESKFRCDSFVNKRRKSTQDANALAFSESSIDTPPSQVSTNGIGLSSANQDNPQKKLLLPMNRVVRYTSDNKPRRRRKEMQPISMVIETKDFPYDDDYVWKNNGNTIHKSSGQKSIYYKCSNSTMGCTVNKTVTFKENGEYLIKYRGNHLEDCSKIKKIVNI